MVCPRALACHAPQLALVGGHYRSCPAQCTSHFLHVDTRAQRGERRSWSMHRFHPDRFSVIPVTPATHNSHPIGFAALGTLLLVPYDTATHLHMLWWILSAALRKGLCGKHRLMTRFLHRERNVWPHCLAVHNDSLDDSPVRYSLSIQAPCIKRCKVKQISQLCTYYLDVFRGKMELPLKSYPDWAFSAAQLRYRINTSLLLQGILLNTQSMGPCRS